MRLLVLVVQLVLGFVLGTVVLWLCSFTVKTPHRNIKTAAKYNAIMMALTAILAGVAWVFLSTGAGALGGLFIVLAILTLVVSFVLLMLMYEISFWATIWLVFAMWALQTCVQKLAERMI